MSLWFAACCEVLFRAIRPSPVTPYMSKGRSVSVAAGWYQFGGGISLRCTSYLCLDVCDGGPQCAFRDMLNLTHTSPAAVIGGRGRNPATQVVVM